MEPIKPDQQSQGGGILAALQNGVQAINSLRSVLSNIFPQSGTVSTTAPSAGTVTFTSSRASIFITVTTSSGGSYKIAGYPST